MGHLLAQKSGNCREVTISQGSTVIYLADFCFLIHRLVLKLSTFQRTKKQADKKSYGFIRFSHEVSVPYTISLMNGIPLYGRAITVKKAQQTTNSPGKQSPSSFSSPPLFVNQNGQSSPFPIFTISGRRLVYLLQYPFLMYEC